MLFLNAMSLAMILVPQKQVFIAQVNGEGDGRDAEAGESTLEAIPSGEGAGVPPFLPVELRVKWCVIAKGISLHSSPWVFRCWAR